MLAPNVVKMLLDAKCMLDNGVGTFSSLQRHNKDLRDAEQSTRLRQHLLDTLYAYWYCGSLKKRLPPTQDHDLAERYRAAHAGTYCWEADWLVTNVSSRGRLKVERGCEMRIVQTIDCLHADRPGHLPSPGDTVMVVERRDSETMNPGDWVMFSESWPQTTRPLVRIYWNASPKAAVQLVHELSRQANKELPYLLKCPRKSSEFIRFDSAVLYFPCDEFTHWIPVLNSVYSIVSSDLQADTPPMTLCLRDGLALAEDPPQRHFSFGLSRCALLVDAYLDAGAEVTTENEQKWLQRVKTQLSAQGIPCDRTYVNTAGSPDYALP